MSTDDSALPRDATPDAGRRAEERQERAIRLGLLLRAGRARLRADTQRDPAAAGFRDVLARALPPADVSAEELRALGERGAAILALRDLDADPLRADPGLLTGVAQALGLTFEEFASLLRFEIGRRTAAQGATPWTAERYLALYGEEWDEAAWIASGRPDPRSSRPERG